MGLRSFTLSGNDLLARVFHGSSEGVAVARLDDGRILEANDAFLLLLGRSRAEVVGATSGGLGLWADGGDSDEGSSIQTLLRERGRVDGFDTHLRAGGNGVVHLSAEVVDRTGDPLVLVRARASEPTPATEGSLELQQLRETMLRYRTLVEQIPAITYLELEDDAHESGFRAVYVSPQSTKIIGFTPEELLADTDLWYRRMPPEDRHRLLQREIRQAHGDDTSFGCEYRIVARDGRTVWFRDEAVLIHDPEKGLRFWQGVMFDQTEQVLAREQARETTLRFRNLVEALPAMVYMDSLDEHATNIYTSPQADEILGYSAEEWMSDPDLWPKIIHPEDHARVMDAQRRHIVNEEPLDVEYRAFHKDGRTIWILDEAVVVRDDDGRPLYSQGFMYDITRRKEAEAHLADALEREHAAVERLEALDRLKNTLLHAVSHDLRSPLATILALAGTLERTDIDLAEDDMRELLGGIGNRARKMDRLLADLLDLDRLDRGIAEPHRRAIDVGDLVGRCVRECEALDGRTVEEDLEHVEAQIDGPKVERIVENLLVNAARHTPAGTRVWVRVSRSDEGVLVIVEDEGRGVPDEHKEAIFEAFTRGVNAETRGTGSGIGLSLVSRFAALHGGRAWVEDHEGGGASFRVLLPG